jgi:hypothetical protein
MLIMLTEESFDGGRKVNAHNKINQTDKQS